MGKFEREILPKGLAAAQEKRTTLERERFSVADQLDFDDEWADHDCDCEFCESKQRGGKTLDYHERVDLEERLDKLDTEIHAISDEINRLTRYKAFVEKAGIV